MLQTGAAPQADKLEYALGLFGIPVCGGKNAPGRLQPTWHLHLFCRKGLASSSHLFIIYHKSLAPLALTVEGAMEGTPPKYSSKGGNAWYTLEAQALGPRLGVSMSITGLAWGGCGGPMWQATDAFPPRW